MTIFLPPYHGSTVIPISETGFEDLTTYTEVDPNSKLTVTSSKADAEDADRDENVYLYKDFGVNYFDALDIDFEMRIDSTSGSYSIGNIGFTVSTVDDVSGWGANDIWFRFFEQSGSNDWTFQLGRAANTVLDTVGDFTEAANTIYYCTFTRGAGSDNISLSIFSDAERTTLLETLAGTIPSAGTFWRYLYAFVNYNNSTSDANFDGFIQNINLNE